MIGSPVRPALSLLLLSTVLMGIVYPFAVTAIGRATFPQAAAGSLIMRDGIAVGSSLIGQSFSSPKYFWSRPSATAPMPYNAAASSGSNQGPTNPALVAAVKERVEKIRAAHPNQSASVPIDLVTASASGLDPHISRAAALYQVERIAHVRGLEPSSVKSLVERHVEHPQWGLFGEARVNVLALNLALDALVSKPRNAKRM